VDINAKCLGVMMVTVNDEQPWYVISTSGYGIGVTGTPIQYKNENLQPLRDYISRSKIVDVFVAPLERHRTIYSDVAEKTEFRELRLKQREQLDGFITSWMVRFKSSLDQLRRQFSEGTYSESQRRHAIDEYLDSTVWDGKVQHPLDRAQVTQFFMSMTSHDVDFSEAVLDRMLSAMHSDDVRSLTPTEMDAGREFMTQMAQRVHPTVTVDEMMDIFQTAADDQHWEKGEPIEEGSFIVLCKYLKISPSFGNSLFFYFRRDVPDPTTSALADFVSQCAEDNAAVEMMEQLRFKLLNQAQPKKIQIQWYSVGVVRRKGIRILHKDLCPICVLRFVERLTELLVELLEPRGAQPAVEKQAVHFIANSAR
jgi:hypothetical protein